MHHPFGDFAAGLEGLYEKFENTSRSSHAKASTIVRSRLNPRVRFYRQVAGVRKQQNRDAQKLQDQGIEGGPYLAVFARCGDKHFKPRSLADWKILPVSPRKKRGEIRATPLVLWS
jgi:hypothetical protein